MTVTGLLLAAGAGRRMGGPKALVRDADGLWLPRAVRRLAGAGCDEVTVVLGAGAEQARELLLDLHELDLSVVEAADWATGMSASLRAGLTSLDAPSGTEIEAALVTLVDLPDVTAAVMARVLAGSPSSASGLSGALARAAYAGVPGHPVLLGRDHWAGVAAGAIGDRGARDYLRTCEVTLVECGDLATGADVDSLG